MAATFGKRLVDRMKAKEMTIRQAASIACVSPSTIQSWRSSAPPRDHNALYRLAKALDTSLTYLLVGIEEERGSGPLKSEGIYFDGYAKIKIEKFCISEPVKKEE